VGFAVDSENLHGYLHLHVRFSPTPSDQNMLHNSVTICVFWFYVNVKILKHELSFWNISFPVVYGDALCASLTSM
jgi:hypothetical protein